MARKRANNEGSLTYREARKRWEGRITVGNKADGTPIRRTVTGRTQAEVTERLESLRKAVAAGPGLPAEVTVAHWMAHWLNEVLPLTDVARTTAMHYERMSRLYIVPTLGKVRLDQVTPAHIRTMLDTLRKRDLSPATQRLARACLRGALQVAVVDGLLTRNPATLVKVGKATSRPKRSLTPDQARQVLGVAEGTPYEAAVTLALALGLRRGELLGLSWDHIDRTANPATLTVHRALKLDERGALYLDEPKTADSVRTIHLPDPLLDVLDRHKARQNAQRLDYGPGWGGPWEASRLVFTTSVGTPVHPRNFARAFGDLTASVGLGRWTPHELRHSAASLLLGKNVPLKTISEMLGHSSIRVTADVYGHLQAPAMTEAARTMENVLWG